MGKGGKKTHNKSRGERKEELERKRDERARRTALQREKQARTYYSLENDEDYVSFCNQLQAIGLKIKEIPGDGNCLFRALADQIDGDHNRHAQFRESTIQYMRENDADFRPFHDGEKPFCEYLELLGKDGTYAGNDAIVAFARNNNVDIVIHQHSSPRFVINAPVNPENIQLHLAYHNGEHYSSLRRLHDASIGPAYLEHQTQQHKSDDQHKSLNKETQQKKSKAQMTKKPSEIHETLDDLSENESSVMQSTSCKDPALVKQALEENCQDVDAAIAYILQLLSLEENDCTCSVESEPLENSSTDRKGTPIGQPQNEESKRNVQKAPHLSNRQRKELAKQAKKKRRLEEQKSQGKLDSAISRHSQEQGNDVGTVLI